MQKKTKLKVKICFEVKQFITVCTAGALMASTTMKGSVGFT